MPSGQAGSRWAPAAAGLRCGLRRVTDLRGARAPSRRLCPGAGWSAAGSAGSEPAGPGGTAALPHSRPPAPSRGPLPSRPEAQPRRPARCSSRPAQQQEPALRAGDPAPPAAAMATAGGLFPWPADGRGLGASRLLQQTAGGSRTGVPERWGRGHPLPCGNTPKRGVLRCPPPGRVGAQIRGRGGGSPEAPGHRAAGSAPAATCWPLVAGRRVHQANTCRQVPRAPAATGSHDSGASAETLASLYSRQSGTSAFITRMSPHGPKPVPTAGDHPHPSLR